jgi:hypothetical protein
MLRHAHAVEVRRGGARPELKFADAPRAQRLISDRNAPNHTVDAVADEPDRSVAQADVDLDVLCSCADAFDCLAWPNGACRSSLFIRGV